MNALGHSKFAMVLAAHARVQGMVAENHQREALGQSMAYTAADFSAEAEYIEELAREIAENGWRPD